MTDSPSNFSPFSVEKINEPKKTRMWLILVMIVATIIVSFSIIFYTQYIYKGSVSNEDTYIIPKKKTPIINDSRPIIIPDFLKKNALLQSTSTPASAEGQSLLNKNEKVSVGSSYLVNKSLLNTISELMKSIKNSKFVFISSVPSKDKPTLKMAESITGRFYLLQFFATSTSTTQIIYLPIQTNQSQ